MRSCSVALGLQPWRARSGVPMNSTAPGSGNGLCRGNCGGRSSRLGNGVEDGLGAREDDDVGREISAYVFS